MRDYVAVLEQRGVVGTRRERRRNGADRIFYAPGLVTLIQLAAFVERFPRQRAKSHSFVNPPARRRRRGTANVVAPTGTSFRCPHRKPVPWNREI